MASTSPTKIQSAEDAEFACRRQILLQEKRKTQKIKTFVVNAKFFFVLDSALKISILSPATDVAF